MFPISTKLSATCTPHSFNLEILSAAVPFPPASRGMAQFDKTINPEYYENVKANNKVIRGLLGIQIILAPIAIFAWPTVWLCARRKYRWKGLFCLVEF